MVVFPLKREPVDPSLDLDEILFAFQLKFLKRTLKCQSTFVYFGLKAVAMSHFQGF